MLGVDGDFCKEFVLLDINWDKDCLYVILPRIVTRLFINIGAVVINKYHIK